MTIITYCHSLVQETIMMIEGRGPVQKRGSGHAGQVLPQDGHSAGDHGHCGHHVLGIPNNSIRWAH